MLHVPFISFSSFTFPGIFFEKYKRLTIPYSPVSKIIYPYYHNNNEISSIFLHYMNCKKTYMKLQFIYSFLYFNLIFCQCFLLLFFTIIVTGTKDVNTVLVNLNSSSWSTRSNNNKCVIMHAEAKLSASSTCAFLQSAFYHFDKPMDSNNATNSTDLTSHSHWPQLTIITRP